ncbi:hypothetical protein QQS21_010606 [Conoideocrella luteorostrata]|uniref:Peptidase S1 domain-containing protein n=1 Tax=Conoideocrella luteorostrata TaxID=1105319 RepID=A0AAJ0CHE9_9HYPO|nr:hypothetical protein QQS21_010606 [Conoideocrella luteorostrata]
MERPKAGNFPYKISIAGKRGYHNCGGAPLNITAVLTAVHYMDIYFSVSIKAGTLKSETIGYATLPTVVLAPAANSTAFIAGW